MSPFRLVCGVQLVRSQRRIPAAVSTTYELCFFSVAETSQRRFKVDVLPSTVTQPKNPTEHAALHVRKAK